MALQGGVDRVSAQKLKGKLARGSGARPQDPNEDNVDLVASTVAPLTRSRRALQQLGTARKPPQSTSVGNTSYSGGTNTTEDTEFDSETQTSPHVDTQVTLDSVMQVKGSDAPESPGIQPQYQQDHTVPLRLEDSSTASYNWDAADLEIFKLLQQQVQRTRARTVDFILTHEALGLQQTGTEASDLQLLIKRVSPELQRFLPNFYPELSGQSPSLPSDMSR